MRTHLWKTAPALTLIALVAAGAAVAAVLATATVKTAKNSTLNTTIIVNTAGHTLYHLTTEKGTKFVCTGQCATIWPPLTVPKGTKPVAGPGTTKSKLGTIKRPDGRIQVTYAGMTLYRYSADTKAGQTNGEGIQNIWFAISPNGTLIKKAASSSSSGGGYGGGGGYRP
jgi:predicted lipoprotein with Yx(FWY)xxD motif